MFTCTISLLFVSEKNNRLTDRSKLLTSNDMERMKYLFVFINTCCVIGRPRMFCFVLTAAVFKLFLFYTRVSIFSNTTNDVNDITVPELRL